MLAKVLLWSLGSSLLVLLPLLAGAQPGPDLKEFKTVENAITTKIKKAGTTQVGSPGYLGVLLNSKGDSLVVLDVEPNSPAEKAGLKPGDVLSQVDGRAVKNADAFRTLMQARSAGEKVGLTVQRNAEKIPLTATLQPTSKVLTPSATRVIVGVTLEEPKSGPGIALKSVAPNGPADKAGLKAGDVLLKVDGKKLDANSRLADLLADRKPGDIVTFLVQGPDKSRDVKVTLTAEVPTGIPGKGKGKKGGPPTPDNSWDTRNLTTFKKDVYRLAVVCVDFPDIKRNEKITAKHWEESLFSRGQYNTTSATGSKVHGSMNDYYLEQSFGKLRIEGKCFDYVTAGKKRAEYAQANLGAAKTALLTEALDKLFQRDGKNCLDGFDGIFFLHAGERVQTNRGGLFWPHKSFVTHAGKRWSYFIVPEGGAKMCDISVICHEFGHMLGLPDLYARPENPGSEGVGVWCAMSNQAPLGKPQHFSAWSKEQLGWINPAVIDPTVKQKLVLSPIENSPKECFKVLARPDGSEYFLLENRKKKGFDASLPAEGLLIWRVVANRPILEESHGVDGPQGPRVFLDAVPFPSRANTAFTPFTTPSSRSQLGGGAPVHITNIRRLPDGRVTFFVGYEYY